MRSLERVNIRTNVRTYVLTYIRTGQTLYPLHNFVVRGDNDSSRKDFTYSLKVNSTLTLLHYFASVSMPWNLFSYI